MTEIVGKYGRTSIYGGLWRSRNLVDDDWLYVGMITPQRQSINSGNPITLILDTHKHPMNGPNYLEIPYKTMFQTGS